MKLSMEILYVPVANIQQKRDMILDWRTTSDKVSKFSMIGALASVLAAVSLYYMKDEFYFIFIGSGALFLLGSIFTKKWHFPAYMAVIMGLLVTSLWLSFGFSKDTLLELVPFAIAFIVQFIPVLYSCRCIYNYVPVFKELQKCKGFPEFIANTADIYGSKMYIKDKPTSSNTQASHNPFNTPEDIRAEEFRRQQDLKVSRKDGATGEKTERQSMASGITFQEKVEYKYGFSVLGKEIMFYHNDIPSSSFEEKKRLMYLWNSYISEAEQGFMVPLFLMFVSIMAAGFGSFAGALLYLVVPLYIMFFNYLKMGKAFAPYGIFAVVAVYISACTPSFISAGLAIGFLILSRKVWVACFMCIVNRPIYKALSKEEGFPSFIRNAADMYGSEMYVVEKREPVKRTATPKGAIVMDIGYDDPPKKDESAWNAFDYMDKKDEEKE